MSVLKLQCKVAPTRKDSIGLLDGQVLQFNVNMKKSSDYDNIIIVFFCYIDLHFVRCSLINLMSTRKHHTPDKEGLDDLNVIKQIAGKLLLLFASHRLC